MHLSVTDILNDKINLREIILFCYFEISIGVDIELVAAYFLSVSNEHRRIWTRLLIADKIMYCRFSLVIYGTQYHGLEKFLGITALISIFRRKFLVGIKIFRQEGFGKTNADSEFDDSYQADATISLHYNDYSSDKFNTPIATNHFRYETLSSNCDRKLEKNASSYKCYRIKYEEKLAP